MKVFIIILLFIFMVISDPLIAAKSDKAKEGDLSLIIKAKIDAGDFVKAKALIDALEGEKSQILRLEVYYHIKQSNFRQAIESFRAIPEKKRSSLRDRLALSHLYYLTNDFVSARKTILLPNLDETKKIPPEYYRLLAKIEKQLGNSENARAELFKARNRFPENKGIALEYWALLVNSGLDISFFTDLDRFSKNLDKILIDKTSSKFFLGILNHTVSTQRKIKTLEALRFRFPETYVFSFALAMSYAKTGKHLVAARFFEKAISLGSECYFEAADQYRLAKDFKSAEKFNRFVREADKRLRQKLTILLAQDQFVRAAALFTEMKNAEALDDRSIYRILYANLKLKRKDLALDLSKQISDPKYKMKANDLLKDLNGIN